MHSSSSMPSLPSSQLTLSISKPRILLVEGDDDEYFFRHLALKRSGPDLQILQFARMQGKLSGFLRDILVKQDGFAESVKVIGIVTDADEDFQESFESIRESLSQASLPIPNAPLFEASPDHDGGPKVVTFVMPDNESTGNLETLCLNAVASNPVISCVDHYFECLKSQNHVPQKESKARLRAFLSSADPKEPITRIGVAVRDDVLPWKSPAFEGIHQFLDLLESAGQYPSG